MVTNETIEGIRAALAKNPLDVVGWLALFDALDEYEFPPCSANVRERLEEIRVKLREANNLALKIQLDYPDVPDSSDFDRLAALIREGIKPILAEIQSDGVTYYWVNSSDGDFWISEKIHEKPKMTATVATATEIELFAHLNGCDSETILVSASNGLLSASDGFPIDGRSLPYRRVFCPII